MERYLSLFRLKSSNADIRSQNTMIDLSEYGFVMTVSGHIAHRGKFERVFFGMRTS